MRNRRVMFGLSALLVAMVSSAPFALAAQGQASPDTPKNQAAVVQQMARMLLAFTENRGQWNDSVLFRTSAGGTTVWFCRDGIYYQFIHRLSSDVTDSGDLRGLGGGGHLRTGEDLSSAAGSSAKEDSIESVVVKATFVGANPAVEITGEDSLAYRCNYFLGNDPAKWRTDVPNYTGVVYRDVYPGVDVHISGAVGQLQTKWEAKPGTDMSQVQFRYDGNATVALSNAGDLTIAAPWGTLVQSALISRDGEWAEAYQSTATATYGLASSPLATATAGVALVYSTYLGGSDNDSYPGIAVDGNGCSYVTGRTYSYDFPTSNSLQAANAGDEDVFVAKLSASGAALVYSTYLGGSFRDVGDGIAVDGSGSAYVTGYTLSTDFPTANPVQAANAGGYDVFVTKLSASGTVLVYSTYLGGSSDDYGHGIAVDGSGGVYVTGDAWSINFPTASPFQEIFAGGIDAFVTKLSAQGAALEYSTYLGGSETEDGNGIAVDGGGNAYVTGDTWSSDFPTAFPLQAANAGILDAFVTKLSASGEELVYSTYLGGSGEDEGYGIAIDGSGSAYATGYTTSTNFPTENPLQAANAGGIDAFVTKLNESGSGLIYSTYLGGNDWDPGFGIAVDGSGNAHVTGYTFSPDFLTANPLQAANAGRHDAFATQLSASGAALVYSTYLGGRSDDAGYGIAVDRSGGTYVTGVTLSTNFPTANPLQANNAGFSDAFVTKLAVPPCACPCHANPKCDGQTDILDVVGVLDVAFRGQPEQVDQDCPKSREDVDCNGVVDILDVVKMVNVAFRGQDATTQFGNPCQ